jgi:hypothetical protein
MGWLAEHLEGFVKPRLGYIPSISATDRPYFTSHERTIIKSVWRSIKTEAERLDKPILLAGRDVYIMEILARREGYPTVFRPDISRMTVQHVRENYSQHFLFDTGYAGSIPKALKMQYYALASSNANTGYAPMSAWDKFSHKLLDKDTHQVFPRMKGSRSLVLKMERTPKYWRRGFRRLIHEKMGHYQYDDRNAIINPDMAFGDYMAQKAKMASYDPVTGIGQEFTNELEFVAAVKITIEIYKDKSPRFVADKTKIGGYTYRGTFGFD